MPSLNQQSEEVESLELPLPGSWCCKFQSQGYNTGECLKRYSRPLEIKHPKRLKNLQEILKKFLEEVDKKESDYTLLGMQIESIRKNLKTIILVESLIYYPNESPRGGEKSFIEEMEKNISEWDDISDWFAKIQDHCHKMLIERIPLQQQIKELQKLNGPEPAPADNSSQQLSP